MNAHQRERAAYIAAHRILTADLQFPQYACRGTRLSRAVDQMAKIINDVYAAHSTQHDAITDWPEAAEPKLLREADGL